MLVLTRKKDESIVIGNDITITVSQIKTGSVRLAINAPKDTKIMRSEVPPHRKSEETSGDE